jgi:ribosomal-protein-serine acetyltransferase
MHKTSDRQTTASETSLSPSSETCSGAARRIHGSSPRVSQCAASKAVDALRSRGVTERLPELIAGPSTLVLRRWTPDDLEIMAQAVRESVEHLRPWMPWVANEPLSVAGRRELIDEFERNWLAGGDVVMGVFVEGRVAGGCGLHHRIGPGGLEIGYWTHPSFLRRGIATSAARLLTDTAFRQTDITHVEIHHDKANVASAGIPHKLGFHFVREVADSPDAPSEIGLSCEWRHTRETWGGFHTESSTDG